MIRSRLVPVFALVLVSTIACGKGPGSPVMPKSCDSDADCPKGRACKQNSSGIGRESQRTRCTTADDECKGGEPCEDKGGKPHTCAFLDEEGHFKCVPYTLPWVG